MAGLSRPTAHLGVCGVAVDIEAARPIVAAMVRVTNVLGGASACRSTAPDEETISGSHDDASRALPGGALNAAVPSFDEASTRAPLPERTVTPGTALAEAAPNRTVAPECAGYSASSPSGPAPNRRRAPALQR